MRFTSGQMGNESAKRRRRRGRRASICRSASADGRMPWRAVNSKRRNTSSGSVLQLQRRTEMRALAVDAELGVFQAAQAVAELRKERAVLRLARIQRLLRGAKDEPRMAVIFAHLARGVAFVPLFGQRVLGIERQHVRVAAGLQMQKAARICAKCRKAASSWRSGCLLAQLAQPAHELVVAQAAGRFLDVGLQMMNGVGVAGVALAREPGQIAGQRFAVGADEARQLRGQIGIERAVAAQISLVEQADVQLGVLVVDFQALGQRAHGVADAQAGIPQRLQKRRDGVFRWRRERARVSNRIRRSTSE